MEVLVEKKEEIQEKNRCKEDISLNFKQEILSLGQKLEEKMMENKTARIKGIQLR